MTFIAQQVGIVISTENLLSITKLGAIDDFVKSRKPVRDRGGVRRFKLILVKFSPLSTYFDLSTP